MSDDASFEYFVKHYEDQPQPLSGHQSLDAAKAAAVDDAGPPLPGYRYEWRRPTTNRWELWEVGDVVKYEQRVCFVEARPPTVSAAVPLRRR